MQEVPSAATLTTLKKRCSNITPKEDAAIFFAWIHISEDPVKGADQQGEILNPAVEAIYKRNFKPTGVPITI